MPHDAVRAVAADQIISCDAFGLAVGAAQARHHAIGARGKIDELDLALDRDAEPPEMLLQQAFGFALRHEEGEGIGRLDLVEADIGEHATAGVKPCRGDLAPGGEEGAGRPGLTQQFKRAWPHHQRLREIGARGRFLDDAAGNAAPRQLGDLAFDPDPAKAANPVADEPQHRDEAVERVGRHLGEGAGNGLLRRIAAARDHQQRSIQPRSIRQHQRGSGGIEEAQINLRRGMHGEGARAGAAGVEIGEIARPVALSLRHQASRLGEAGGDIGPLRQELDRRRRRQRHDAGKTRMPPAEDGDDDAEARGFELRHQRIELGEAIEEGPVVDAARRPAHLGQLDDIAGIAQRGGEGGDARLVGAAGLAVQQHDAELGGALRRRSRGETERCDDQEYEPAHETLPERERSGVATRPDRFPCFRRRRGCRPRSRPCRHGFRIA